MTTDLAAAGLYTDLGGLSSVRRAARAESPEATREVARQFEAMLLQTMLASARTAGGPEQALGGGANDLYRDLHDKQLALHMTRHAGLGVADMIERQLNASTQLGGRSSSEPSDSDAAPSKAGSSRLAFVASLWAAAPRRSTRPDPAAHADATHRSPERIAYAAGAPSVSLRDWAGNPRAFIERLWPAAVQAAHEIGTQPEAVLAVAALETGWGKHVAARVDGHSSNNLFGIKTGSRWRGDSVEFKTKEFEDGRMVSKRDAFRAYDSPEAAVADFAALITGSSRYEAAVKNGADPATFVRELHRAGYATDPDYADKLISVMRSPAMSAATQSAATSLKNAGLRPTA